MTCGFTGILLHSQTLTSNYQDMGWQCICSLCEYNCCMSAFMSCWYYCYYYNTIVTQRINFISPPL